MAYAPMHLRPFGHLTPRLARGLLLFPTEKRIGLLPPKPATHTPFHVPPAHPRGPAVSPDCWPLLFPSYSSVKDFASTADNLSCRDEARVGRAFEVCPAPHRAVEGSVRMQQRITHQEAVRLAKERLGDAPSVELAAYIQKEFGLTIRPPIVTVLLGTFQEREALDRTGRAVRARIDGWKAENPEEAMKLAATAKRKEAARRKKAASKAGGSQEVPVTPRTDSAPAAPPEPSTAPEPGSGVKA